MKNAFYFMLKALFVIKILKCLSSVFDHVGKPLDKKANINFKIYDIKDLEKNNCNTHIAQYFKKCEGNLTMKFNQLVENNMRNYVYQRIMQKMRRGE